MTWEIAYVYGVLLAAIALFASGRLRLDVVALLALLALALAGVLEVAEALAGFADPVVLMIAGLFIVGDGLFQTGVAARMARLPARVAGDSEVRLIAAVMLIVALLSAFMSSTGAVAVMIPAVMGLAWERGISPSRLLIPLAVASLLGGMLTLIGTPPNIVVSNQLAAAGRTPFGFFSFTPVGLVMLVVGVAFTLLVGRRLLPERRGAAADAASTTVGELAGSYRLPETLARVRVPAGSPLVGQRLDEADLRGRFGVTVVDIRRPVARRPGRLPGRGASLAPGLHAGDVPGAAPALSEAAGASQPVVPETRFAAGDLLLLQGAPHGVRGAVAEAGLEALAAGATGALFPPDIGLVEVLLTPGSRLVGQTLREAGFREQYRVTVLGVFRMGQPLGEDLREARLRFGDALLVKAPWPRIRVLQQEQRDFVLAARPRELEESRRPLGRAPLATALVLGMLVLMTSGVVAPVLAVLIAAVAMVLTGCVRADDSYRAINWESVVLIAAFLPMATALEKTGGLALLVGGLDDVLGGRAPILMLAALFILTSALSQVISNTATAVLLAPIAVELAARAAIAPEPLLMGIAVAASTAFATPIASPVNVLVLGPGGYRFGDFFKLGVALQILLLAATLAVVPALFPFGR
jgi:di/tricarboxylate transporter